MNIAMYLGTILYNDTAAIQVNISIDNTCDIYHAIESGNSATNLAANNDGATKSGQIATFDLIVADNHVTTERRPHRTCITCSMAIRNCLAGCLSGQSKGRSSCSTNKNSDQASQADKHKQQTLSTSDVAHI
jgi:hypothetical protein